MAARSLEVSEKVSASKKLGRDAAREIATSAKRVVVAKGKKVTELAGGDDDEVVDAMLGSTGNLRAPLIKVGKTVLVGFNADVFEEVLG